MEPIPKTFEFNANLERINQVITAEAVYNYIEQKSQLNSQVEEAMSITSKQHNIFTNFVLDVKLQK